MQELDAFIDERNHQTSMEVQRLSQFAISVANQGNDELATKIMAERDVLAANLPEGWTFS